MVPFFLFAIAFLVIPSASLFSGSFQNQQGQWTLQNIGGLATPSVLSAFSVSIQLSLVTALLGGIVGLLLAWAALRGGLPRWTSPALLTFCGVASNFAGVPLAFSFIATYGRIGLATGWLDRTLGFSAYQQGLSLYGFWGLSLVYLYFQIPLMVLIITPALEGLKPEWSEAAQNLGASGAQFLRYVALPVLLPSILGTMILLVRQRLWGLCHRVCADGRHVEPGTDPRWCPDSRRCAPQPESGVCARVWHGGGDGGLPGRVLAPATSLRAVDQTMKRTRCGAGPAWDWRCVLRAAADWYRRVLTASAGRSAQPGCLRHRFCRTIAFTARSSFRLKWPH